MFLTPHATHSGQLQLNHLLMHVVKKPFWAGSFWILAKTLITRSASIQDTSLLGEFGGTGKALKAGPRKQLHGYIVLSSFSAIALT